MRKIINTLSEFGKNLGIHNLGDYHDLYLRTDVVLLANVYKAFRDTCLKHYKLGPVHSIHLQGWLGKLV